jgi:hypothetical protein
MLWPLWKQPTQAGTNRIAAARRIVVKIGSALLVDRATGRLDAPWFDDLVTDLARLRKRGQEVLVVSSGAIALGRRHLGLRAARCGWKRARRPPPPARSGWRTPGRRRWRATTSRSRRCC